jgi:hypothetical protein
VCDRDVSEHALIVYMTTNAPTGLGRQCLSVSREAVPNSNHCIRVGTACDKGVWPFEAATRLRYPCP